jgi:MSHA biogenesis protein MshI
MSAKMLSAQVLRLPSRWINQRSASIGLQWLGERLALARVQHGHQPQIELLELYDAPAAQRARIVRALSSEGAFKHAHVQLLLAPGQYDLHHVPAPAVPAEEMRDALRWQLRGSLSYPPEEAVIDFVSLPRTTDAPNKHNLLVVTARRAVVLEAVAPLLDDGIDIGAVDVPELAQHQLALAVMRKGDARSIAWLAFDDDTCLFTVHCAGQLAFARRMLLPASPTNATADAIAHFCERIATQIQRSIDLFERQSGLPAVVRVVLGPHVHRGALATLLPTQITAALEFFSPDLLSGVGLTAHATQCSALTLPSLGAALRAPSVALESRRAA